MSQENIPHADTTPNSSEKSDGKKSTGETRSSKKFDLSSFKFLDDVKEKSDNSESLINLFSTDKKEKSDEGEKPEVEDSSELSDLSSEESPVERLSSDQIQDVAEADRAIARESRDGEVANDTAEQTGNDAVDDWDSYIVDKNMKPEAAAERVFADYGIDPSEVDIPAELRQAGEVNTESEAEPVNNQEVNLNTNQNEGEIPLQTTIPEEIRSEADPSVPIPLAGSGSGGGQRPPTTPPPGGSANQPPSPNPWRSTRLSPNQMPFGGPLASNSYNTIRRDHRDYWSGFMTGGIVGYFVGHRRGRIKTEKKLNTVKRNLEKQINEIHEDLKTQEMVIRKVVSERARKAPDKVARPVRRERAPAKVPELVKVIKKEVASESIPAAEIHIGRLVMAEKPREINREVARSLSKTYESSRVERRASEPAKKEVAVESMSRNELLKASEDIIIDGTSLRNIYETQLVGEKGLRRLVSEYRRGGDLGRTLKKEILERQIDFERDPAMRDTAAPSGSASGNINGQQSLESMIKRAEAALTNSQEEVAFLKAKAAHEVQQNHQHTRAINAVFLSIITFLVVLIILVGLLKHG